MKWECSECGETVERHRAPVKCPHCGTAGVIFVRAEPEADASVSSDSFRDAWLRAGLERAASSSVR